MSCPVCYLYIKTRLTKSQLADELCRILCEVTQEACSIKTENDCHTKVEYDCIITNTLTLSVYDAVNDEDWRSDIDDINDEFMIAANGLVEFSFLWATQLEGWERMYETIGYMWPFVEAALLTEEADMPYLLKKDGILHVRRGTGRYADFTTPQRIALLRHPYEMM